MLKSVVPFVHADTAKAGALAKPAKATSVKNLLITCPPTQTLAAARNTTAKKSTRLRLPL
jgi:hypothetical protein